MECRTDKNGLFRKCSDLISQYRKLKKSITEVAVLFPGHHLIPLAWLLTRFPRKKLTFDIFISVYDTLVSDRKKVSPLNPIAWVYYIIDFVSCLLADEILIDTKAHREFFIRKFKINPGKIRVVYLETRKDLFFPKQRNSACRPKPEGRRLETAKHECEVFFYGSFIPLQGIDTILKAAKILQDKDQRVHFTLLGGGQTKPQMLALAEELKLTNTEFLDSVPIEELPNHIHEADICLGIFGTSYKAQRVIPHKVLDYRACGKKVITERSPAILERFANDGDVILCEAGDPKALAECIIEIQNAKFKMQN